MFETLDLAIESLHAEGRLDMESVLAQHISCGECGAVFVRIKCADAFLPDVVLARGRNGEGWSVLCEILPDEPVRCPCVENGRPLG
jgi:hypothetical protein